MPDPEPWTILSSRYLLQRPWMRVRADHVALPGGRELEEFNVVEYPDWALVLCFTEENQLVMTKQYRHGVQQACLELPSGMIDAGETPLEAAQRELREETGYAAPHWETLGRLAPDPSRHTHYAHLFVATGARRVAAQQLDASEQIAVYLIGPEEVLAAAGDGRIIHAVHVAGLLRAVRQGYVPG